jgi:hypothetical protein
MFVCMYVWLCVCVCSDITLECLERFQPNFVHIWLYVCARILCIFYIYIYLFIYLLNIIFSRENGVGGLHGIHLPGVTNRCRGNVYANRYRNNSPIVCVVLDHTNMRPFVFRYVNHSRQFRCHMTVKYVYLCVSGQWRIRW